jgi:hypothetical protein
MTILAASILDVDSLADVVAVSFVAGISVTAAYAFAIVSLTRLSEHRRAGRTLAATAYTWLAGLALAVSLGLVALGIAVMVSN